VQCRHSTGGASRSNGGAVPRRNSAVDPAVDLFQFLSDRHHSLPVRHPDVHARVRLVDLLRVPAGSRLLRRTRRGISRNGDRIAAGRKKKTSNSGLPGNSVKFSARIHGDRGRHLHTCCRTVHDNNHHSTPTLCSASEMTCIVSGGALNSTHSLTPTLWLARIHLWSICDPLRG